MSLDVTVATTDRDLTTTSALKDLILGATGWSSSVATTALDAQLATYIRAASKWAETFLGFPVTVQTYREAVAAYGRRSLLLSRTPVLAVNGLFNATSTDEAVESLSTEYILEDRDAGLLTRNQGFMWTAPLQPPGSGGPFLSSIPLEAMPLSGQEYRPWLADYVAGWTYAGLSTSSANWSTGKGTTSTGRTLPEDVEQAVLLKAQALFDGGDEVAAETLADMTVNYRSLGNDERGRLLTRSEDLLKPYRRVV